MALSPNLLAELRAYWRKRRGPQLFPGRSGPGSTLTRAAISKALQKALVKAGLSGRHITVHTMRHYAEGLIMPRRVRDPQFFPPYMRETGGTCSA